MSKKPKSRAEAMARTREKLIQSGIELFGQKGLDAPSLDEICDRAGYTRGAFYVHFDDRDEFLVACMGVVGARFLDAVIATTGEGDDGGLAITARRFVEAFASGSYPLSQPTGVRPHQLIDACARSPKIRETYVELVRAGIARLAHVVHADQASSKLRKDVGEEEAAVLLLALIIGAQTLWDLGVGVDVARLARTALRLLL